MPGKADKTESLITAVMFACSRFAINAKMYNPGKTPDLHVKSIAELPLCTKIMSQNFAGVPILFSGIAYFETLESQSEIRNELMMVQQGTQQKYEPVDLVIT
jgi:hypothetical protein